MSNFPTFLQLDGANLVNDMGAYFGTVEQINPALRDELLRRYNCNTELLYALYGAMFFIPLGTKARDRAEAAITKAQP